MSNKLRIILFTLITAAFVDCGKPLPIEEMSTAKLEISRAESYKASRFAPQEIENARKAMYASHDYASDEKIPETKAEAEKAIAFAREALAKALPLVSAEAKENAGKAIEEADRAFAVQLAADDFNKAVELVKVGDENNAVAARTMESYKTDKKLETQQTGVDQYEVAIKNFRDAEEYAKRASTLAISQKQQIIDSSADIEETIAKAERYGADQEQTGNLKQNYKSAIASVEEGKIKEGFENLDAVRKAANELVASSIKDYAERRKAEAGKKIAVSDAKLTEVAGIKKNLKEKTSRESIDAAKTQLQAGKEALGSAEDLFGQEQYENSVVQSDEAIRLADIVLERTGMLVAQTRSATITDQDKDKGTVTTVTGDGEDGVWKKYIVKKRQPADCLWRIAGYKEHYNNPKLWRRIYKANSKKIKNPNRIYPKQVLIIPPPPGMEMKKEEKPVGEVPEATADEPKAETEGTVENAVKPDAVQPTHEVPAMEGEKGDSNPPASEAEPDKAEEPNKEKPAPETTEETIE